MTRVRSRKNSKKNSKKNNKPKINPRPKPRIGSEVVRNDLREVCRVIGILQQEGKETLYQVDGYSVIESGSKVNQGHIECWLGLEDITI